MRIRRGVRYGMVHRAYLVPTSGDPEAALLYEVLGSGEIPDHEVPRPQEVVGTAPHELLELLSGSVFAPRNHHVRSNRPEGSIISLTPPRVQKVASIIKSADEIPGLPIGALVKANWCGQ
jgi:hypothetical protein